MANTYAGPLDSRPALVPADSPSINDISRSAGLKSADAVISDHPTILKGVDILEGGADATLILYDNASAASGTVLWKGSVSNGNGSIHLEGIDVLAENGIYADITGASAEYVVRYTG